MHVIPRVLAAAAVAVVAVLAGGLAVVSSPAAADALSGGEFRVQRFVSAEGPATCTVTEGDTSGLFMPFSSGGTASDTVSGSSTVTDTGDGTDTATVTNSITGTIRTQESAGRLTSLVVTSRTSTEMSIAQGFGTDCDPVAQEQLTLEFSFVMPTAQWTTIRLRGALSQTEASIGLQREGQPAAGISAGLGGNGRLDHTLTALLPAGIYNFNGFLRHILDTPQVAGDPLSESGTTSLEFTFADAGSAIAKAAGSGRKFLKVGKAVNCGANKLTSTFTNAAGIAASAKLKKATFFVNGKKKKSIGLPTRGDKVTLTNLKSSQETDLRVVLQPFRGAPVTVTRSYLSCT